jgi:hypothetical protein
MCNCGSKRDNYTNQVHSNATSRFETVQEKAAVQQVQFQYNGKTSLTVIGNITGTRYRFTVPGVILAVDLKDAAGMSYIQMLSKI